MCTTIDSHTIHKIGGFKEIRPFHFICGPTEWFARFEVRFSQIRTISGLTLLFSAVVLGYTHGYRLALYVAPLRW